MPIRALVIAIEEYPRAETLQPQLLEGTHAAAESFISWLREKKAVSAEDIRYCAAEGRPGRTDGTTREDILAAALALVEAGRDKTPELYIFFSGHGFSFDVGPGKKTLDVLVTAEFRRPQLSGGACILLREFQEKLQVALGPGDHYYFIDACRNVMRAKDIEPTQLGVTFGSSNLGIGTLFTLYSTATQSFARVDSGFSRLLVDGLCGKGRAKGWVGSHLYVTFDLLRRYVRSHMPNQDADVRIEGSGDGCIIEIQPVPQSSCRVRVLNADARDTFDARVQLAQGVMLVPFQEKTFQGAEARLDLPPGDYVLEVRHPAAQVKQQAPPEGSTVDAYDACEVVFEKQAPAAVPLAPAAILSVSGGVTAPTALSFAVMNALWQRLRAMRQPVVHAGISLAAMKIRGPRDAQLEVTSAKEGTRSVVPTFTGAVQQTVRPGSYEVRLTRGGKVLSQRDVDIQQGESLDVELGNVDRTPRALRELELPCTMPAEERTAALMLSLLGAGRIVAPHELPPRARALPLQDFSEAVPGTSLVYVLAFFEQGAAGLHVAVGGGATPDWRPMKPVAGVAGLWEASLPAPVGPSVFSFQPTLAEGGTEVLPRSYVTHLLPGRATLVTLSAREASQLELHQYLLPLGPLLGSMPWEVREPLMQSAARFTQALWEVQDEFAAKHTLATSLEKENRDFWESALYGKWLDPNMALFSAYELLRRRRPDTDLGLLHTAINNLRQFFGGIPDIELLAKLAGLPYQEPASPPLILDGLLSWAPPEGALPLSASKLTYEGPWVMWRNAVAPVSP